MKTYPSRLDDAGIHKRHCGLQKVFALVQPLHRFRLHRQKIIEQKLSLLSVVQSVDKIHHSPASTDAKLPLDQIEARAQRQLCPKNVQIFLKSMVHMIAVHPSRLSFLLVFRIFVLQRHPASAKPPQPKISFALSIFDRKLSFHTLQNAAEKSSQGAFVVIPEIPPRDISCI